MTTENEDYGRHSPDVLLQVFSRSRMVFWGLVAVGVHAAIIVMTSAGYIRDQFNPEGAAERAAAALEAKQGEGPAAETNGIEAALSEVMPSNAVAPVATDKPLQIDGETVPADLTNAVVIRRITALPGEDEKLPEAGDIGLDLDDTRVP